MTRAEAFCAGLVAASAVWLSSPLVYIFLAERAPRFDEL